MKWLFISFSGLLIIKSVRFLLGHNPSFRLTSVDLERAKAVIRNQAVSGNPCPMFLRKGENEKIGLEKREGTDE